MARKYDDSFKYLEEFIPAVAASDRNEAATRMHLIDTLFFECLGWDRIDCDPEDYRESGFADYVFGKNGKQLIVEAKKEGIFFELPEGFTERTCTLPALFKSSPEIEKAVKQSVEYCQKRGVPIGAITNGTQLIGFIASRQDGTPPLEGQAIVFRSFEDMLDSFEELWNNFSCAGITNYRIYSTLKSSVSTPPEKLASYVADYPGFKNRNELQNELQLLGGLFLEDLNKEPRFEEDFLESCYCRSGALSQYALVSRQILEARYSSLFRKEMSTDMVDVGTKRGMTPELASDILAAGLSRRPIILLGEVGAGKSMFIKHFINVEAKEILKKAVVLYIDFGKEPALPDKLSEFVILSCKKQLSEGYSINIEDRNFVSGVYWRELEHFKNKGIYSEWKKTRPEEYAVKEVEFLEGKIRDAENHLRACLEHIAKGQQRQIVVFLDNVDQRPIDFQDQVFLIGNGLAETWPGTVFISLRPETFFQSKKKGSLTGYQPRVFTISPPRADLVIAKRLEFAIKNLSETGSLQSMPSIGLNSKRLLDYITIVHKSLEENPELNEFVDNVSGGNIREAIGFFTAFIGSGHVNTAKILSIYEEEGRYTIALHEFMRAVIFGDHIYYNPASSPIANLFDISSSDGREHFLLPIILLHVERMGNSESNQGYVPAKVIFDYAQSLGYRPEQVSFALRRGVDTRMIEAHPRFINEEKSITHYRITTVGAYTIQKMSSMFTYLDAVVVDTPITHLEYQERILDVSDLEDRLRRATIFCDYLDSHWRQLDSNKALLNWDKVSKAVREQVSWIRTRAPRYR